MKHLSTRNTSERVGSAISRTIVEQVDDTKLMQQHNISGYAGEKQAQIEHVHPYGFSSVVQPPSGGSNGSQRLGAEGFMGFMGGGRSHGVVFMAGDRRFRLYKLQNGEVALHDDQGQQLHIRRDGIWGSVPQSKKIQLQIMDDDKLPQDSGGSGGQKMGQIQQAGRAATINLVMDKNQFTLNHPQGAVTLNCKTFALNTSSTVDVNAGAAMNLVAPTTFIVGQTHVGVPARNVPGTDKVLLVAGAARLAYSIPG